MDATFTRRGFLPADDPLSSFAPGAELAVLDEVGHDLPSLLHDPGFRKFARELTVPPWPAEHSGPEWLPALRLYYLRLGFLASAYVNQVGQPRATILPRNLALPLCHACRLLKRPPILSYDGYALYNWKRFDPRGPIALGNIDTLQNFVHLYDEHWFILVHVEIEAIAAEILAAIAKVQHALAPSTQGETSLASPLSPGTPGERGRGEGEINTALKDIADAVRRQVGVLARIPEKMDPRLYYEKFRPYIRFFENVVYEGVPDVPIHHRGETGAQSSIMPALIAFMKIDHKPSKLTDHLADMRNFMPAEHRAVIAEVEAMPSIRDLAAKDAFNEVLEAMATFREVHIRWAKEYIQRWEDDPRGTGGTPYMKWLKQLIDETRGHKK
ncbi:MAG: indoleamine 2,3-dioxygenase [Gemmataceae bacterium]|nr:indoleamine 2,3-dioxygenase [Gemmataceae bacterium]